MQTLIKFLSFVKDHFLTLVIFLLVAILFTHSCVDHVISKDDVISVKRDTVWVQKANTVITNPQLVQTIPVTVKELTREISYVPDTNYNKLLKQYMSIVKELLAKNIYVDSLKIDSIGYVKVFDTVSKNKIVSRKYSYQLKYPLIKETITLPVIKKNQVYVGGGLGGSQIAAINQVNAGVLFKNKKDQIFSGTLGLNSSGQIIYGINSYWKISFRK